MPTFCNIELYHAPEPALLHAQRECDECIRCCVMHEIILNMPIANDEVSLDFYILTISFNFFHFYSLPASGIFFAC